MRNELERLLKEANDALSKVSKIRALNYWQGKIDALNEAIDIFDNQDCSDCATTLKKKNDEINEEMKKFTQGFSYKPPENTST